MNNSVHIKINYDEAISLRKTLLSSEVEVIKVIKIIKKYQLLRTRELKLKQLLNKHMNDSLSNLRKIEKDLPKTEKQKLIRKEERESIKKYSKVSKEQKKESEKMSKEQKESSDLEAQLKEIQNKLNSLQ